MLVCSVASKQSSDMVHFLRDMILDRLFKTEYSILNNKHFIGIHGYTLDVASKPSFDMVRILRDKILNHLSVFHSKGHSYALHMSDPSI